MAEQPAFTADDVIRASKQIWYQQHRDEILERMKKRRDERRAEDLKNGVVTKRGRKPKTKLTPELLAFMEKGAELKKCPEGFVVSFNL